MRQSYTPPLLDHASYIGPIAIRESKGKGRGVFLTRSVKAGELLICEKAFAAGFVPKDKRNAAEWALILNPLTGRRSRAGQTLMISEAIQKIHRNPSLSAELIDLHRGIPVGDEHASYTNPQRLRERVRNTIFTQSASSTVLTPT